MVKRKKTDSSKFILGFIIIFFSIILFLSIPVLLDYNSLQNKIEKKFYTEFKINLEISSDISLKIFPKPYFLVKKANLDINPEDDASSIIQTQDLKIFIPLKKLYSRSNIKIDSFEISEANIYFKIKDIINFRNHLYYKINKPIYIRKSNFFLTDKNNNTILISPIKKIKYLINKKNKSKELKITGNIFDIDYVSHWKRNYSVPQETLNEIKLKNPNIFIKNIFKIKDKFEFMGQSSIDFLNENITLKYLINDNEIFINSPNISKKQKIKLESSIRLNPFIFDTKIIIDKKDTNFIIDNILYFLLNLDNDKEHLGNLNGDLSLIFTNIDNSIIDNGKINFSIKEKSIKINNSIFEIKNIGKLKSDMRYYENEGDLIFLSENILEIIDKKEFARKFQISLKKLKKINKIFFNYERNIDSGEVFISNIHLNEIGTLNDSAEFYKIKNIQTLKALIRKVLS